MENFIYWLASSFLNLINAISGQTLMIIDDIITNFGENVFALRDYDINLVLFSETPILITNAYDLLLLFFSIFYTIIFITIVWKIIKKVVVKITGWNRW